MSFHFNDRRASGLLSRVRDDVTHLRRDLGNLLNHTTRKTLPRGARELADTARDQLAAGTAYATSRVRSLRGNQSAAPAGIVGGAVLVGLLAAGAYMLLNRYQHEHADD